MATYAAGYLGGHPDHPKAIEEGHLEAHEGGLRFAWSTMENMLPRLHVNPVIPAGEMRALVTDPTAKIKRKGKMASFAVAGVAGLAHHAATTAKRNAPLAVEAERDGQPFTVMFVTDPASRFALLNELSGQRRALGLPPLDTPSPGSGGASGESALEPPDAGEDPIASIERLAELHAKGAITTAQFEEKRAELLKRV